MSEKGASSQSPATRVVVVVWWTVVLAVAAHAIAAPSSKDVSCTRLTPKFSVPAHVMPGYISSVTTVQIAAGGPEEVVAVMTPLPPAGGFSLRVLTFDSNGAIADRKLLPLSNSTTGVWYGPPLGGDFDGDDYPDLLMAGGNFQPSGGTSHDLFLGRSDGSFEASTTLKTSLYAGWQLAGDVDGDGRTELILQAGNEIRVYGFESGVGWSLEGISALKAQFIPALGDFDGDALQDLALVRFSEPDQITLAFGAAIAPLSDVRVISFSSPSRMGKAVAAQLDGGGAQEILIRGRLAGGEDDLLAVSISATRDVVTLLWEQTLPELERAWTVRDIDGDGLDDVWFGPPANADTTPGFTLYLNRGAGPLVPGQRGTAPAGLLATRDLDGDGCRDAILLHGKTFLWYRGLPGPTFDEGAIYREVTSTAEPLLGDLDEDGTLDFVSANGRSGQQYVAHVQFGNGDGTFRPGADVPLQDNSITLRLHDIDGDGHLDVLEPSRVTPLLEVHVSYGRGDGTFEAPRRYAVPSGRGRLIFGDLDSDGDDDVLLVGSERYDRELRWNRTPMHLVLVDGRTWTQAPEFSVFGSSLPEPTIGDLDNDSRVEVVYGSQSPSGEWTVGWRALLPTGKAFGDETVVKRWPENGPVTSLELLDLDGDGRNELFVRGGPAPYVARVFKRNDRGTLRVIRRTPRVASFGRQSRLADIDADGRLDDVITDHWATRWHRGDGEGGFDAVTDGWYHYGAPGVADLDHDGRPDLIGLHNTGTSAPYLLVVNLNRGSFVAADTQPTAVELRLLPFVDDEERPADFDGSWRVQLIATDDCDAVPIVTRRRLDLEQPPVGAPVLYRAGEGFEVRYWIVPGTGEGTVLLIGSDEAMTRARWAAVVAAGGFALEPGQLITLAITDVDGASPSALGDNGLIPASARLAVRYVEQGARLRSATESHANADITVSAAVADLAGKLVEVGASLAEEKRRYCEQGGAAAVVCP